MRRLLVAFFVVATTTAFTESASSSPPLTTKSTSSRDFGAKCTFERVDSSTSFEVSNRPIEVTYNVTDNGRVADVNVLEPISSYEPELHSATINCLSNWQAASPKKLLASSFGPHRGAVEWHSEGANGVGIFRPIPGDCTGFYPNFALRLFQEGDTVIAFDVAVSGLVQHPIVLRSSGHQALDEAALACAKFMYSQYKLEKRNEPQLKYETVRWWIPENWRKSQRWVY